jgi:hypothetical protein
MRTDANTTTDARENAASTASDAPQRRCSREACGQAFIAVVRWQKFCGGNCRRIAFVERKVAPRPKP